MHIFKISSLEDIWERFFSSTNARADPPFFNNSGSISLPILPDISLVSIKRQNSYISLGLSFKSNAESSFSVFTNANKSFVNQFATCLAMFTFFFLLLLLSLPSSSSSSDDDDFDDDFDMSQSSQYDLSQSQSQKSTME